MFVIIIFYLFLACGRKYSRKMITATTVIIIIIIINKICYHGADNFIISQNNAAGPPYSVKSRNHKLAYTTRQQDLVRW